MADPVKDSNGNFVDSTGVPMKTPDSKPPVNGEEVQILNNSSEKIVKGHWDGSNVVFDDKEKDSAA